MITLEGEMYERFKRVKRLGLLWNEPDVVSKKIKYFTRVDGTGNFLFQLVNVSGNKFTLNAVGLAGMGVNKGSIAIDLGSDIVGLEMTPTTLLVIGVTKTMLIRYTYVGDAVSFVSSGQFDNIRNLDSSLKTGVTSDNNVYAYSYQFIYVFKNLEWVEIFKADYFISAAAVTLVGGKYNIFIGQELSKTAKVMLYLNKVKNSEVIIPTTAFKDGIFNTINELYVKNNTVYLSFFSGYLLSGELVSGKLPVKFESVFEVKGSIEKITVTEQYIIAMHDINEITVWNKKFNEIEYITLPSQPIDIVANDFFIFVYLRGYSLHIYKLSNIPDLIGFGFNYSNLEKRELRNNTYQYYLNTHVSVGFENYHEKNEGYTYTVNLIYRKRPNTATKVFPESNVRGNLYMDLLDRAAIYREETFALSPEKVYYEVINNELGIKISNKGTPTLPEEVLYKFFMKDFYTLDDNLFFRTRFLLTSSYTLLVEVDNKKILIVNGESEEAVKDKYVDFYKPDMVYTKENRNLDFAHKFNWFSIPGVKFSKNKDIRVLLLVNYGLKDMFYTSAEIDNRNAQDIKYLTTDGEIHHIEFKYLSELEDGNKSKYLETMGNPAYEEVIPVDRVKINKERYIGDSINDEPAYGYLDFSTSYNNIQEKQNSLLTDIYLNGKHAFRRTYKQRDSLSGVLYSFLAVRRLEGLIEPKVLTDLKNGKPFPKDYELVITANKRKLFESETFIHEHIIDNTFENQTDMVQTVGLSLTADIPPSVEVNDLRVYVMKKGYVYFRRINPSHYYMTIDREYGYIKLFVYASSYMTEGSIVRIVSSGASNGNMFFDGLEESVNPLDSLPYIETDINNNMYTSDADSDDIDVNVNGLTLIPKKDYIIVNPDNLSDTPPLIVFSNTIPKAGTTIEITRLNKGSNKTVYFRKPAVGTTNIFSMDDDRLLFIKNTFSVFVNNKRLPNKYVNIVNMKTIKIEGYTEPLVNVFIRFSYDNHTNLQLILDSYKYDNIDMNDSYYHSYFATYEPSNFDKFCGSTGGNLGNSVSTSKLILKDLLNSPNFTILNCNFSSEIIWDITLDTEPIETQYARHNIDVDMNPIKGLPQPPSIIDPKI